MAGLNFQEAVYFSRRLAEARRAQSLSASIQFDLARLGISDDELEAIVDEFVQARAPGTGWGLSEVFQDILSREPQRVRVRDIKRLQEQLVMRGYMPPDTPITGVWDESWYGAFRRFDRDAYEVQRSGRTWSSGSLYAGLNMLAQTLPPEIWRNIVGWSKGFVEQAPETAERLGLVGGAAAGAAIGTAIKPGLGTVIGAAAGATVGFFSDFLGFDEDEPPQQEVSARLVDALTPWEEYKDRPEVFWEDVGWVLSAAAVIGGAKFGIQGARGAISAWQQRSLAEAMARGRAASAQAAYQAQLRGATSFGEVGQVAARSPWFRLQQPIRNELGLIGTFTRGVLRRVPGQPLWSRAIIRGIEKASPYQLWARLPALQVANKIYTGAATASVGVTRVAGLGQGARELNEQLRIRADVIQRLAAEEGRPLTEDERTSIEKAIRGVGVSTIERAIAREELPRTGIEVDVIPFFDLPLQLDRFPDLLYLSAFFLWPERFFPWRKGTIAGAVARVAGDERGAWPFIEFLMRGGRTTFAQARAQFRELNPTFVHYYRLEAGLHFIAERRALQRGTPKMRELMQIRDTLNRGLVTRTASAAEQREAAEIMAEVHLLMETSPETAYAHLVDTAPENKTPFEALKGYEVAEELALQAQDEIRRHLMIETTDGYMLSAGSRYPVDLELPERAGVLKGAGEATFPRGRRWEEPLGVADRAALKEQAAALSKRAETLMRRAQRLGGEGLPLIREAQELKRYAQALTDALRASRRARKLVLRTPLDYEIMVARKSYLTAADYHRRARDYLELRREVVEAAKQGLDSPRYLLARDRLDNWLEAHSDEIPLDVLEAGRGAKPKTKPADWLKEQAEFAGQEVIPPNAAIALQLDDLGYKLVATSRNVIRPGQVARLMDIQGTLGYARRTYLMDTLGLSPRVARDDHIWRITTASERGEFQQVIDAHGLKVTPVDIQRRLYRWIGLDARGSTMVGPVQVRRAAEGKLRVGLARHDLRSLRPPDILEALKDIPGMTERAAMDLYGAIRRARAFGGEAKLSHPIISARSLGRAMRINGLSGFADWVRTAHAADPRRFDVPTFDPQKWIYRPHARFARSPERKRVEREVLWALEAPEITMPQRHLTMMMLDAIAEGSVAAGTVRDLDTFYRNLSVEAVREVVYDLWDPNTLLRRHLDERYLLPIDKRTLGPGGKVLATSRFTERAFRELEELLEEAARVMGDKPGWYQRSHRAIFGLFGGRRLRLRNGEVIDGADGFIRVLAVTSGGALPAPNLSIAIRAFHAYLQDPTVRFANRATATIEAWGEGVSFIPAARSGHHTIRGWHAAAEDWVPFDVAYRTITVGSRAAAGERAVAVEITGKILGADRPLTALDRAAILEGSIERAVARGTIAREATDQLHPVLRRLERRTDRAPLGELLEREHYVGVRFADDVLVLNAPKHVKLTGETLDDIWKPGRAPELVDRVFDGWVPDTPKFGPFRQALMGDLDAIVIDRRMLFLGGFFKRAGGRVTVADATPAEEEFMRNMVREVARRTGLRNAVAQERLWVMLSTYYERLAHKARRAGDTERAELFEAVARGMQDNRAFDELLAQPEMLEKVHALLAEDTGVLFKRLENEVLGAAILSPDGMKLLRVITDADWGVLVHEMGHLLRRMLPEHTVRQLERYFKVRPEVQLVEQLPARTPLQALEPRSKVWRTSLAKMRKDIVPDDGGATWDPRTGKFIEFAEDAPEQFTVSVEKKTGIILPVSKAVANPQWFSRQLRRFINERRERFETENIYLGLWHKPGTDELHVDVSTVFPPTRAGREATIETAIRYEQQSYGWTRLEWPKTPRWTDAQEEAFADAIEAYFRKTFSPPRPVAQAFEALRRALGGWWRLTRGTAADLGEVSPVRRHVIDEWFKDVLNIRPRARSERAAKALVSRHTLGGAALGSLVGAWEGREDGVFDADMWEGAALGAASGLGLRTALGKTYGYLPDHLARLNLALRFTLSITFDAGRYVEQNLIAGMKYNLPFILSPRRWLTSGREFKSPYVVGKISGDEVFDHALRFWDDLNEVSYFKIIDDVDRRAFHAGLLGFQPRLFEAAQAFILYQRGWGKEAIKEAIANIGRYGVGRSAAEKSANFIFFPFSFSKKYLETLGDFILGAPGRNLLVTEGLRRYWQSSMDDRWSEFVERHAPLLKELWRINNLAWGLSPGRFFLEGLADNRTLTGKAGYILMSIFAPSGAATPLALAAGTATDLGVNAFVPVVLTGESIDRLGGANGLYDVIRRYIPLTREVQSYWEALNEQKIALTEGAAPWSQFMEYHQQLHEVKGQYRPLAQALGYADVDGFLQSPLGAGAKLEVERVRQELAARYPTGLRMSAEFQQEAPIVEAMMNELMSKEALEPAEEAIVRLREMVSTFELLKQTGLPASLVDHLTAQAIWREAQRWADDRRFAELYDLFFARYYGPIRRAA